MIKSGKAESVLAVLANVILASAGLGSFLVLIYYLYWYQWSGVRGFNSWSGMMFSYGVPAVLGGVFLVSLVTPATFKTNLAILSVSIFASIYTGEYILRLSSPTDFSPIMIDLLRSKHRHQESAKLAKKYGVEIDARTPKEFIADLGKKGVDAIPIVIDFLLKEADGSVRSILKVDGTELLPLAAISNRLTVLCNEGGHYVSYESDEHGFNNPKGIIWGTGAVDVVVLGDSFAHGYCVSPNDSFVGSIRRKFNATLNLGIVGNGPLTELASWREYGQFLKPKKVLWFYFEGNDLDNLEFHGKSSILNNYLRDGFTQNLISRQDEIDKAIINDIPRQIAKGERDQNGEGDQRSKSNEGRLLRGLVDLAKLGNLRNRLGLVGGANTEKNMASELRATLELFVKIAARLQQEVSERGGKLYFVYLPDQSRYEIRRSTGVLSGIQQRARVLSIVKNLGIPVIDMLPVFAAQGDPLSLFPFRSYGHYNEAGHRIVGEEVLRSVDSGK